MVYSTKPTKIEKKPYTVFPHAHLSGLSHLLYPAHLPHQFSHSARTALQNGHSQKLIRAEREGEKARFATQFRPNGINSGKSPLGGGGFF